MAVVDQLNGFILCIVVAGVLLLMLVKLLAITVDPREPPLLTTKIPLIGHLIGLLWYQSGYYHCLLYEFDPTFQSSILTSKDRADKPVPAFTLNVLTSKIYVISSPALVQAAMRSRNLDFEPFIVAVADRMLRVSPEAMETVRGTSADPKEPTYLREVHNVMHSTMQPGAGLLEMNTRVLHTLGGYANDIGKEWEGRNLYRWVRDSFTIAAARSLYGPYNIIEKDPSLIDHLWNFDADQLWLLAGRFPSVFAPKACKARDALQLAFQEYYTAGHDRDASTLVRGRNAMARKWNISIFDIAQFEVTILFVATTNAIPSVFWLLVYILSDPQLVQEVRNEVLAITTFLGREATVDIARFNTHCPVLSSAYNESLRLTNAQVSARCVAADTVLSDSVTGDTFLLKKGNVVQMPSGLQHTSTHVWGANAGSFDAYRFMRREGAMKEERKAQTQGFFPFGGAKHLCPGRSFALAEILGMVSVLVLGFDFRSENGKVHVPPGKPHAFGEAVQKPMYDIPVQVRRRKEFEDIQWKFNVG
ncbi:MAG: hypothetical protein M1818_002523 [Claussenomyces sp. TS43310]|nr:MAG: hypothetical protein M1818_002523 [Claussenomyces sp. TS43310]